MKEFKSSVERSCHTTDELMAWCSDFRNIITLLPDQAVNRVADNDTCSFTISGMADIALKYAEKNPAGLIRMVPDKSPFHFELKIAISKSTDGSGSDIQTTLLADLNPMLSMLASRPLSHLTAEINRKLAVVSI